MATVIRPKLSGRNKYYISKHRHYELKHFCLQYPEWKRLYMDTDGYGEYKYDQTGVSVTTLADHTNKNVEKREDYFNKMKAVEQAAIAADADLSGYIFKAVTEDMSYNTLKASYDIPCSRDMYYDRYRKFFWLLDKIRE